MSVEQLQRQIEQLPREDCRRLAEWFDDHRHDLLSTAAQESEITAALSLFKCARWKLGRALDYRDERVGFTRDARISCASFTRALRMKLQEWIFIEEIGRLRKV